MILGRLVLGGVQRRFADERACNLFTCPQRFAHLVATRLSQRKKSATQKECPLSHVSGGVSRGLSRIPYNEESTRWTDYTTSTDTTNIPAEPRLGRLFQCINTRIHHPAKRTCSNSASENCLSTSAVKIPGKLGSPWEYSRQTEDADRAFNSLVRAVEGTSEATMKTIDLKRHYVLAQFPSKVRTHVNRRSDNSRVILESAR